MSGWSDTEWLEMSTQDKRDWYLCVGKPGSGVSTTVKAIAKHFNLRVIDWVALEEAARKKLGTEEEPFSGPVPFTKSAEEVLQIINKDRKEGTKATYICDSLPANVDASEFISAFFNIMGTSPLALLTCKIEDNTLMARYKKKMEVEEISEEQQAEIQEKLANYQSRISRATASLMDLLMNGYIQNYEFSIENSEETMINELKEFMVPKVILVNHEKRLTVDTTCANLAIKYNFIYISVYQIIKQHIEQNTEFGKRLMATKKPKDIKLHTQAKDEFFEIDYSAVHFDLDLVIELVKHTINQVRGRSQRYILLEGFCNSGKLIFDEDRYELRYMDELFGIEKHIGEVQAIIGLQFNSEKEYIEEYEVEYEQFPEPEEVEVKKNVNEDGEEEQQPPAEEEGEKKAPAFKVEDWKWTITDRKPKNLPQLFVQSKGIAARHELRTAEQYSSSQYEAISKCLDEFCSKVIELSQGTEKYLYQ